MNDSSASSTYELMFKRHPIVRRAASCQRAFWFIVPDGTT